MSDETRRFAILEVENVRLRNELYEMHEEVEKLQAQADRFRYLADRLRTRYVNYQSLYLRHHSASDLERSNAAAEMYLLMAEFMPGLPALFDTEEAAR